MWNIVLSVILSLGAIFGAQSYTEQHGGVRFGASQPISALTAKTSLSGNDTLVIVDNDSVATTKKITVTNASTSFKTYNDATYSSKFTTSAGLAALLSDETGSGGVAVFNSSPTITTPTIASFTNSTHNHTNAAGGGQLTDAALSAAVGISKGGTGQTSANAGFNALSPMTTGGDLIYGGASGAATRLANGSSGQFLKSNGGTAAPSWQSLTQRISYAGTGPNASTGYASTTLFTIPSGTIGASSTIVIDFSASSLYNGTAGTMYLRTSTGALITAQNCGTGTNGQTTLCIGKLVISFISATSQTYAWIGQSVTQAGVDSVIGASGTLSTDFSSGLTLVFVAEALNASNNMNVQYLSAVASY